MAPKKKLSESQIIRLPQLELESLLQEWKVEVPAGCNVLKKRVLLDAAMCGEPIVFKKARHCGLIKVRE